MALRKVTPSPQRVFGYCRVSTQSQAGSGISIDEQRRKIAARAVEMEWELSEVFVDAGVSGSIALGKRPEGSRLLAAVQPGDIVIVARMDRAFRSALDALTVVNDFRRRKIGLWLLDLGGDCTGNGIAQLLATILGAVADFERSLISERIIAAKENQRRARKHLGGSRPFGYQLGNRDRPDRACELVEDPQEQAAIGLARTMRHKGRSLMEIRDFLRGRGFAISHETVRSVLQREAA